MNSLIIYKYAENYLFFGKFCGRIPQLSTFVEGSNILIHLDSDTLTWHINVEMIYQIEGGIFVSSGNLHKIYPVADMNEEYFRHLSNQAFVTNRQESAFVWQFKIFNIKRVDSVYTMDVDCP